MTYDHTYVHTDSTICAPSWAPSLLPSFFFPSCKFLNFALLTFMTTNLHSPPIQWAFYPSGSLKLVKIASVPVPLILLSKSLLKPEVPDLALAVGSKMVPLQIRELLIMSFSLMIPQLIRQPVHLEVSGGTRHPDDWSLVRVKLGPGLFRMGIPCKLWSCKARLMWSMGMMMICFNKVFWKPNGLWPIQLLKVSLPNNIIIIAKLQSHFRGKIFLSVPTCFSSCQVKMQG